MEHVTKSLSLINYINSGVSMEINHSFSRLFKLICYEIDTNVQLS